MSFCYVQNLLGYWGDRSSALALAARYDDAARAWCEFSGYPVQDVSVVAIVTHLLGEAGGPIRDIDRWPQMRAAETFQRRAFNWSELTPTTQAALEGLGVTNQTDMDGLPERSGFHLLLSVSGEWVQITYSTESL